MSSVAHRSVPELEASLGFTRAADVSPDAERPSVLRAKTLPFEVEAREAFDFQTCTLRDCLASEAPTDLETMGFETIDLSQNQRLQDALAIVRKEDRVSKQSAFNLRTSLRGCSFRLGNGKRLRLLFIAPEGLIFRRAGPNGLQPGTDQEMDETGSHDGALRVHADQDVYGTPLKQMFRGVASLVFRHDTPDGRNKRSPFFLLNLWIPLQQITRPLVLMDRRTLNKRHQLRYALPVTSFLERDEDRSVNDIWTFLHDPGQQWYFHSDMDARHAYTFDTLGQPHGSCVLPGEPALEELHGSLRAACDALSAGDSAALKAAVESVPPLLPDATSAPIREAYQRMTTLLEEAQARGADLCARGEDWTQRARAAMDRVIRKSVEMRVVAMLAPRWWPQ